MSKIVIAGKQALLEVMIPLLIQINLLLVELRQLQQSKLTPPRRKGIPKITLHFKSLKKQVKDGKTGYGQISFRLMENSHPSQVSLQEATLYAQSISSQFGGSTPFVWHKGKIMCSYTDWDRGLQFQVLAVDGTEGRRVVKQVLDVLRVRFDPEFFNRILNESPDTAYPKIPEKRIILGETVRDVERRPIIDVTFRYATLDLGSDRQTLLCDLSGNMGTPLVD
jgi:hypothetical protein